MGHTRDDCDCRCPDAMGDVCNGECHESDQATAARLRAGAAEIAAQAPAWAARMREEASRLESIEHD